jgi:uncharacterized membrane protein YhaH (DUF805 family)
MYWMLLPYRRYFEFSGRSRRKEYWMFSLLCFLVGTAISIIFGRTIYSASTSYGGYVNFTTLTPAGSVIYWIFVLASFIPSIAVWIRRLHDIDRSGWWALLIFLPILGWFTLFVFACLDGTRGSNRFGPDPKNPYEVDVFQ